MVCKYYVLVGGGIEYVEKQLLKMTIALVSVFLGVFFLISALILLILMVQESLNITYVILFVSLGLSLIALDYMQRKMERERGDWVWSG